jgi:hypothetical protein
MKQREQRETSVETNIRNITMVASVTTAFCMVILTFALVASIVWSVNTVDGLRSTYHPDKISSIVDQISDTVNVLHSTTHMLQSNQVEFDPVIEFQNFAETLKLLVDALEEIPMVVGEAAAWRNMSTSSLTHLRDIVLKW